MIYLLPYYKEGLDAVIVQDMGVFKMIREMFPGMHLSCQHADDCDRSGGDEVSGRTGCFQSGNCQRTFP